MGSRLEGPEVTDGSGLLRPAEPGSGGSSSGLLSCGIDARVGEVLKQGHVHVSLWEEQVSVEQKQAEFREFKVSLVNPTSSRTTKATETLS